MLEALEALQGALGSRYDVLTHLGTGGMAEVYLARDTRNHQEVAVKVIREELAAGVDTARFLREIRITEGLTHPNVRPLLDSGSAGRRPYYVMPFIRGETLRERVAREETLGLEECLRIAIEVADALAYAHQRGIVHRDVKPSNIFLTSDRVVLSDFGIALAVDSADEARLTESGRPIGTVEYMSPEQAGGQRGVDGRSDLYSLGCVLFEMLTGQPPHTGRTPLAVIAKHLHEPTPSPAVLRSDLPIEVEEIVTRCLAQTPADRIQTAAELSESLQDARDAWSSGTSRGPALALRGRRPRHWRRTASVGAAAVLAATLGISFLRTAEPELDPRKIVVFPLADRGGTNSGVGAGVALMITNALTHAEPLRAIDGWQRLGVDERSDARLVTQQAAREASVAAGAAHFLTGGVSGRADSVMVLLVLHDARGDSIVGQAAASAAVATSSADQVGLRAMIQLLPALIDPGREVDLSFLLQRDPAAVALWIQGDQEYRQARFPAALTHYGNAVAQDSLLALAALMGAKTANWMERWELAQELVAVAQASDSLLPQRHRHLARGLAAYLEGMGDVAVREVRAAVEDDPEWSDAWMILGDVYQHLLPSDVHGVEAGAAAFREAVRLDPEFVQPMIHLAEYAIRAGRTSEAREYVERVRASGAEGSTRVSSVSLVLDCVEESFRSPAWVDAVRFDPAVVLEAAQQLAVGGAYPDCAEDAFRSIFESPDAGTNRRWAAAMGLQGLLVAQDRVAEAGAVLDEAEAAGISTALFLPIVNVWAGADMAARAERVDSLALSLWGEDYEGVGPLTLWVLGVWKARIGETTALARIRERIHQRADSSGDAGARLMAAAIDAHHTLALGDTATATEMLSDLRSVGSGRHLFTAIAEPLAVERLVLAELLLRSGEMERAYWTAAAFDHPQPIIFSGFLPSSLAIRHVAARALRGSEWEARAEEARARLERLGRMDLLDPL